MTPKLVIFDCDGVLVDSEPTTDLVLTRNLAKYGLTIPITQAHTLFAGGTMKGAGEEAVRRGATLPDDWLTEIYAEQSAALAKGVPVIDGVAGLLDQLDAHGIATAIASNGPMAKMRITLTPSGLWDRFAGRIYSGHDYLPKPDPAMLLHACKTAGVAQDAAAFIDDTAAGCGAARGTGIPCFGFVPTGDTSKVAAVGATPVRSMAEIADIFGVT